MPCNLATIIASPSIDRFQAAISGPTYTAVGRICRAHDTKAFAALFADDVDFVTKSGTWFKGKAATMKHPQQNHATIFKHSVWSTDSIDMRYLAPDVAIIHVGWELSDDTHHDGSYSAPRHGISMWVLAKRREQWQLIAFTTSTLKSLNSGPATDRR